MKVHNILGYLLDPILISYRHFEALFRRFPTDWKKGGRGDVIILPGFSEPWIFLRPLAEKLNQLGYRIHLPDGLNRNLLTIDQSVAYLAQYIERNDLKDVILLAHSKGGFIGKLYLDQYPGNCKKLFSIATPYAGTSLSRLHILHLNEFAPTSETVKRVNYETEHNDKIINIYTLKDLHIFPHKSAHLKGASNFEVNIVGHTRIIGASQAWRIIEENL